MIMQSLFVSLPVLIKDRELHDPRLQMNSCSLLVFEGLWWSLWWLSWLNLGHEGLSVTLSIFPESNHADMIREDDVCCCWFTPGIPQFNHFGRWCHCYINACTNCSIGIGSVFAARCLRRFTSHHHMHIELSWYGYCPHLNANMENKCCFHHLTLQFYWNEVLVLYYIYSRSLFGFILQCNTKHFFFFFVLNDTNSSSQYIKAHTAFINIHVPWKCCPCRAPWYEILHVPEAVCHRYLPWDLRADCSHHPVKSTADTPLLRTKVHRQTLNSVLVF